MRAPVSASGYAGPVDRPAEALSEGGRGACILCTCVRLQTPPHCSAAGLAIVRRCRVQVSFFSREQCSTLHKKSPNSSQRSRPQEITGLFGSIELRTVRSRTVKAIRAIRSSRKVCKRYARARWISSFHYSPAGRAEKRKHGAEPWYLAPYASLTSTIAVRVGR